MRKYLQIALMLFFISCNNNVKQTEDGAVYQYKPLHWEILIPKGWKVLTEAEIKKIEYKAKGYYQEDQLQKQYGEKKIIMGLQKPQDKITAIYAFTTSYRLGDEAPRLKDILTQQYRSYSAGVYTADTSLLTEGINGRVFEKATLNVRHNKAAYFSYITYSTSLSDTLVFGVSIVTSNSSDSLLLLNNFKKSIPSLLLYN